MKKSARYFGLIMLVLGLVLVLAACSGAQATKPAATEVSEGAAHPSNPGGPGPAASMTGDAKAGETIFANNCASCHGDQGKGGVANAGSSDGTVPALNPIDETIASSDVKAFATNMDLFLEHGSTPNGSKPEKVMAAFGDTKALTPQQIADVIAYVISLNKK